jgi:hypothetical protein
MSQNPLFLDPTLKLEKVAYDTRLDEDPEEWPVVVIRESYKQLPFLKSFETEVEFDKVDPARGYAVGKLIVWPARMEKAAAAEGKQLVSVPVIIRDREMAPLDVFSHNKMMQPMNQDKVAMILFRPQTIAGPAPMDQFLGTNLYGQLIPPNTDHQYNAGTLHKHGAVAGSLWDAVQKVLCDADIDTLAEKLASDAALKSAYATTPVLRAALVDLSNVYGTEKTAAERRASRLASLKPTVVQVQEKGKSYLVKTANHHCFAPQQQLVSRFEVQRLLSEKAYERLINDGSVTYTTEVESVEQPVEKTAQVVDCCGVFEVRAGSKAVEGIVIPRVVDFDGHPLDLQVFAGADTHSLQEKVAGVFVRDARVESDAPSGLGVFVYQEGTQAFATEPVKITGRVKVAHDTGSTQQLVGVRMATGTPLRVTVVPGLQKISMIGNEVALPETFRFVALRGKQAGVMADPADVQTFQTSKTASDSSVEVVSDGSFFSLRGDNARVFPDQAMSAAEAAFALCTLGLSGEQAQGLMKTARARGSAVVPRTRRVIPEEIRVAEALEKVAGEVAPVVAVDLTKELALLTSPRAEVLWKHASVTLSRETADAILSLGFVTPENASLYVNYLPELEKVANRLAELLIASRLGMDDIREAAAKNAMTQVDAVVRNLEALRDRIG